MPACSAGTAARTHLSAPEPRPSRGVVRRRQGRGPNMPGPAPALGQNLSLLPQLVRVARCPHLDAGDARLVAAATPSYIGGQGLRPRHHHGVPGSTNVLHQLGHARVATEQGQLARRGVLVARGPVEVVRKHARRVRPPVSPVATPAPPGSGRPRACETIVGRVDSARCWPAQYAASSRRIPAAAQHGRMAREAEDSVRPGECRGRSGSRPACAVCCWRIQHHGLRAQPLSARAAAMGRKFPNDP